MTNSICFSVKGRTSRRDKLNTPISSLSFSIGTPRIVRTPPSSTARQSLDRVAQHRPSQPQHRRREPPIWLATCDRRVSPGSGRNRRMPARFSQSWRRIVTVSRRGAGIAFPVGRYCQTFASQMPSRHSRSMLANTGCKLTGELLMTPSTSEVAVCCSRASFSSRVSRATSASSLGADELERATVFGALRRFGSGAFRRRPLMVRRLLWSAFSSRPRRLRGIVAGRRPTLEVAYSCSSNKPLCRQLLQQRLRLLQIERVEALQ